MDKFLYTSMAGAKHTMQAQAISTNNLANANTDGFKADYSRMIAEEINGPGYASKVHAVVVENGTNFNSGPMISTSRDLDVAVKGNGWMAVRGENDDEGYIKTASLTVSPEGILLTPSGRPVLGSDNGPIAIPPADKIQIGEDGTISIRPQGQGASTLIAIDKIKLVRPEIADLEKGDDGMMYLKDRGRMLPDPNVEVVSGFIEGSNVNAVEEMINMINYSRQFETDIKMMKLAEELDSSSAQLLKLR